MTIISLLSYKFIINGLIAGLAIAVIAPLIGVFLVLRRYSLIADTLAHVSLAGIAIGALIGINPIMTAITVTVISSLGIERLRATKTIYGESALALFLSGSLALAVVILSFARGLNANLLNFLFGSIVTVTSLDVKMIITLAALVIIAVFLFFKELVSSAFDEEAAKVNGIPVKFINILLILVSALAISVSIPVIGALLVAAMIVIPVTTALQIKTGFGKTIIIAEAVSITSVLLGMISSFYLNIPAGGATVLVMLLIFSVVFFFKK